MQGRHPRRVRRAAALLCAALPLALGLPVLGQPLDTETGLRVSPRPGVLGEPVTFTATVRSDDGPIAGQVAFRIGERVLGRVTLPGTAAGPGSVAAGELHSCALTEAGALMCWGANFQGQLGDGGVVRTRAVPGLVPGLESGVVAVVAGDAHTCALGTGGEVWCWGYNATGQLGVGDRTNRMVPTLVEGLPGPARALAAGEGHSCAIAGVAATAWCWGNNMWGQIGDDSRADRLVPRRVVGLGRNLQEIAAGESHTCALDRLGRAFCWGLNSWGQLGDGTQTLRAAPVPVDGLGARSRAIAAGSEHSCALDRLGRAFCWGSGTAGQLGTGDFRRAQLTPAPVSLGRRDLVAIGAGWEHSCVLDREGRGLCWGGNEFGEVGDGTTGVRPAPVRALTRTVRPLQSLAVGFAHNCAVTHLGAVRCWGLGWAGQIGNGRRDEVNPFPVNVVGGRFASAAGRALAVFTTSNLRRGQRCVTAHYEGTEMHAPSVSPERCLRIRPVAPD